MSPDILRFIFETNHGAAAMNLQGITHKDSLVQPGVAGNCLNWVLGHIVVSRGSILRLVGEEPVWDEAQSKPYARGVAAVQHPSELLKLEIIKDAFGQSQKTLDQALRKMTPEAFSRQVSDKKSLGQQLAFLQFHETYHIGQLGLLRRILGLKGAIQ